MRLDALMRWRENCVCLVCVSRLSKWKSSGLTISANAFVKGFLEGQVRKAEIPIRPLDSSTYYARSRTQQEIDELEERLNDHESRIQQMNTSLETLNKRYLELTELRHVLRETATFFDEVRFGPMMVFQAAAYPHCLRFVYR